MKISEWTYRNVVYILAALLCCGCVNMEEDLVETESGPKPITMVVSLRIDQEALNGGLRATTGTDFKGTTAESEINTLTLFITKINGGKEEVEGHKTISKPDINQLLRFEIPGVTGYKQFYLGANMTDAQIAAFTGDKSEYTLPETPASGYANTHQLMDINYEGNDGAGSNIMMTSRITSGGQQKILVKTGEITIDKPVALERVVSKTLLTCTMTDATHIKVQNDQGWAKLENVRYRGNVFNRKLYYFPQADGSTGLKDSNYEIAKFITKASTGNYVIKNETEYKNNFLNFDAFKLVEELTASTCKPYHQAIKYDSDRLKTNSPTRYTEGLFFPENRVKNDLSRITAISSYTEEETSAIIHRLVSTHLLVAVKYVPNKVWHNVANSLKEITVTMENEMLNTYLPAKTEVLEGLNRSYRKGTFWYYDKKYYTLEGLQLFLEIEKSKPDPKVTRSEIERFDGGWGFYFSFIDGKANANNVIDYEGVQEWGLTRNHYYILNVTQLIPPGSSTPGSRIIKIPTERVDWINKGNSDVDVVP